MTIAEKILAKKAEKDSIKANDIVMAKVDVAMSHENADVVLRAFKEIGVRHVWDPERIVILFDHRIPADSEKTASTHKRLRTFVHDQKIQHFYDLKEGICHQVLAEFGHDRPGELLVGTDSHTTTHGAFGTFATGIGATEMAGVWATGEIWLRTPETIKVEVTGRLRSNVYAKDVILHIIGLLHADGANYQAVEFHGPVIENMSIASRMVLCNLSMEMGAKTAFVIPDKKTQEYVSVRTDIPFTSVVPDNDAHYAQTVHVKASDLLPQIACPHAVDNVSPVRDVKGVKVHQALIGSCTNGRLEDLEVAARLLDGKTISSQVRLLVIPASRQVYLESLQRGLIEVFIKAGGLVLNPGCGPCLGAHQGLLAPQEVCIATTNRNFKGRMGSTESFVYLASPATVAASALTGEITEP